MTGDTRNEVTGGVIESNLSLIPPNPRQSSPLSLPAFYNNTVRFALPQRKKEEKRDKTRRNYMRYVQNYSRKIEDIQSFRIAINHATNNMLAFNSVIFLAPLSQPW